MAESTVVTYCMKISVAFLTFLVRGPEIRALADPGCPLAPAKVASIPGAASGIDASESAAGVLVEEVTVSEAVTEEPGSAEGLAAAEVLGRIVMEEDGLAEELADLVS